jgi:hypothetical protein
MNIGILKNKTDLKEYHKTIEYKEFNKKPIILLTQKLKNN